MTQIAIKRNIHERECGTTPPRASRPALSRDSPIYSDVRAKEIRTIDVDHVGDSDVASLFAMSADDGEKRGKTRTIERERDPERLTETFACKTASERFLSES